MKIVVIFETEEGQTKKIADYTASLIEAACHEAIMVDTSDRLAQIPLKAADMVILAAPVHERRHPKTFEVAVAAAKDELALKPTLMLSVSLKAAFPEGQEEAQDYLDEMALRTGFEPTKTALIAGAVRVGSYDYFQQQVVQHVALDGREVALKDGVREFTEWDELQAVVTAFVADH